MTPFKLRLTKNLKRAIARLKEEDWQGCHNFGILQTAELKLQLSGWSHPRRVVVGRRLMGHTGEDDGEFWSYAKYEYKAYVTSLDQAMLRVGRLSKSTAKVQTARMSLMN